MEALNYILLLLITLFAYRQTLFSVWLILFCVLVIICLRKRLYRAIMVVGTLSLILNPKWSKPTMQETIVGKVVESKENYYIVKTKEEKVLIWSKDFPKQKQILTVTGKPKKWGRNNFFSFDSKKYYLNKNITYNLMKGKILTKSFDTYIRVERSYLQSWFNFVFRNIKDDVSKPIYNALKELGLVHIVIISSFHIGGLFLLLDKYFNSTLSLIIIFLLCWYIGFTIPAQKALLFIIIKSVVKEKLTSLQIISLTGIILIIKNPKIITSASFLLTILFSYLILLINTKQKYRKIFALKTIGIYINWMFSGVVYYFNYISLIFTPIILITYLAILIRATWLLKFIERFLLGLAKYNQKIVVGFNPYIAFALFITLVMWLASFLSFHKKSLRYFIMMLLILFSLKKYLQRKSFVTFINVGQADSALIKIKDKAFLIDVGREGQVDKIIAPYLYKEGVDHVNAVFISHNHVDHNGGLEDNSSVLKRAKIIYDFKKESIFINLNQYNFKDINNKSSIIYFEYNGKKFLFAGDIEKEAEAAFSYNHKLDIDVLKIAHHGSKSSTTQEFLMNTKPNIAIISVGNNGYGHPHKDVINRLKRNNVAIYITQEKGAIKIDLNGYKSTNSYMV